MKSRYWIASFKLFMLFLVATLCIPSISHAATATPEPSPKPLFVLTEYDPWRMVIGSDSPTFALYDNGLVIYVGEDSEGNPAYLSTQLDTKVFNKLREALTADKEFFALDSYYDIALKTDQPTSTIVAWDKDGTAKKVGVYGDLRDDDEARDQTPKAFLTLFDAATAFTDPDATEWLPEKFEVMIWEYDTSGATRWPNQWPDLDDPTTVKRDQVYSIYVDASELPTYRKLAENATAVRIDGKTWAFSMRFPFPNEDLWHDIKAE
jgi:hypothetical protein